MEKERKSELSRSCSITEESIIAGIQRCTSTNDVQDIMLFDEPIATSTGLPSHSRKMLVENCLQSIPTKITSLQVDPINNSEKRFGRVSNANNQKEKNFSDFIKEAKERFPSLGGGASYSSIVDYSPDKLQNSGFLGREIESMLTKCKIQDSSTLGKLSDMKAQSHDDSYVRISAISCPWSSTEIEDDNQSYSLSRESQLATENLPEEDFNEFTQEFSDATNEFKEIKQDMFNETEEKFLQHNKIMQEDMCSPFNNADASSFYGREGDDISISASCMDNTLRNLAKTGNKVSVDELFKTKSYKLGVLGGGASEKPSFGFKLPIDSPNKNEFDQDLSPPLNVIRNLSEIPLAQNSSSKFLLESNFVPNASERGEGDGNEDDSMEQLKILLKANNPKDVVAQILALAKNDTTSTVDQSEIQTSFEVQELRRERQALHLQQQNTHYSHGSKHIDSPLSIPLNYVPVTQLIGISSNEAIEIFNNLPKLLQIKIESVEETMNGTHLLESCLNFGSFYIAQPASSCRINFELLCLVQGAYKAIVKFNIYEVIQDLRTNKNIKFIESRLVTVTANFEDPLLELNCENENWIDFGCLLETCTSSRKLILRNKSQCSYTIQLKLHSICSTNDILFWGNDSSQNFTSLSPFVLSCDVPADPSVTVHAEVKFRAPHFQGLQVSEKSVALQSALQVFYVLPNGQLRILELIPIKALVSKICLRTPNDAFPIEIKAPLNDTSTIEFPIYNDSDIPLKMSLQMSPKLNVFSVWPLELTIDPGLGAEPKIFFHAKSLSSFNSALSMTIEPDGLELEVPFLGHCLPDFPLKKNPIKIHSALQQSKSDPLKSRLPKEISLKSNKSRLIFGCVSVDEEACQKLVLRNRWTSHELTLSMTIFGSNAFKFAEENSVKKLSSMEIQIKPCGEVTLFIYFKPTEHSSVRATLISKPKGLQHAVKYSYHLQGYGGRGKLLIPNSESPDHFSFGRILPRKSTIKKTMAKNIGSRSIFVKLQIIQDELGGYKHSRSSINVHPTAFILKPNECCDIVIVVDGSLNLLSHTPGKLAVLHVIYGNEIMMQRFKKSQHSDVKRSKLSDPSLLEIDWTDSFPYVSNQDDPLPSQPEDALLFFQDCTKYSVPLNGEFDFEPLEDSTMFVELSPEDTISSFIATPIMEKRTYPLSEQCEEVPRAAQVPISSVSCRSDLAENSCETIRIFPHAVSFIDGTSLYVTIENLTHETIMIEVLSSDSWFSVKPMEVILTRLSSQVLHILLHQSYLPWSKAALQSSFKILCENGMFPVRVSVDASLNPAMQHISTKAFSGVSISTEPMYYKEEKSSQDGSPFMSSCKPLEHEVDPLVEIDPPNVVFSPTKVGGESVKTVTLRNFNHHPLKVKDISKCSSFYMKHESFSVKPRYYVAVPIYFRPLRPGKHRELQHFSIDSFENPLCVSLSGDAFC